MCFAARQGDDPDLRFTSARRDESDRLAVGRPARTAVRTFSARELAWLAAIDRLEPNVSGLPVGFQIDLGQSESHPVPVRRKLRIGNPLDLHQVVEGDGALGLCYCAGAKSYENKYHSN